VFSMRISHVLTVTRLSPFALIAFFLLSAAHTAFGQSAPGYQAPRKLPVKEESSLTKAARGQAPLARVYTHLKPDASRIKHLPALSQRLKRSKSEKLLQVGVVRTLSSALNPLTDSAIYSIAEGDVRVAAVRSEGARYMRVLFKDFSLPAGARVFVYSKSDTDAYAGPYEGRGLWNDGTFWTPALRGDQLIIEYLSPAGEQPKDAPFKVSEIAHIYKDQFTPDAAGACNLEVTSPWANAAKSVGMLQFVTGGLVALCTGTLLNDSNTNIDHHVLTANHCISSQSEAQSAQIYWNYNSGDDPPGGTPSSFGANLMVTGTASDFTLLRFGAVIPGLFYSGWDANPVGSSTSVTGIHHPQGSHKRISFGATNSNCPAGLPGPCANFSGVTWSQGVTEPGSSGSAIWTGAPDNPTLVGTLTGGESACNNPSGSDYYGRFSVTYPNISDFLSGTSCVTSISPSSQSYSAAGGTGTLTVTAPAACNWTASSTAAFLTITSGASGTGNGTINFSVAANSDLLRSGSIVAGTQVFTAHQEGGGVCAATPISFGQTVNGTLSTSDCPLGDGSYVDAYSFSGTTGQRISILMTSSAFDTFLYLLKPDGSVLQIDDDGGGGTNSRIPSGSGFLTLPTTGSYTILANSFEAGATGSYSLTLSEQPKKTLTVTSTPITGLNVAVFPTDTSGQSDGTTQFTRTYYQSTTVALNVPGIVGNSEFKQWQKDGVTVDTIPATSFGMDADHTLTAVYGPITTYTLTVASSNPGSGVAVSVSPNDNAGMGNGTTEFTRTYNRSTFVDLTAAATAPNGNIFQKWQRDGVDLSTNQFVLAFTDRDRTYTAVYVVPNTFSLTVNSTNPNSGVNITVSPNDNNGAGDGTTGFVRSYQQTTAVTLTAPPSASNGNIFDRWLKPNGDSLTFSPTANIVMAANTTLTAVYLTKPVLFAEDGTNNVAALDSVLFTRGPFRVINPNNLFTADHHTRIIFFTSELGLTQSDLSDPAILVVDVPGYQLPVENVGTLTGVPGLSGSYIIVRLPDGLPAGALQMRVRLRGVTSDARTLNISP
jgi:hypothetical protein